MSIEVFFFVLFFFNRKIPLSKHPHYFVLQQTRMEERLDLDDAIHVLRTHAEGQPLLPGQGHPGLPPSMIGGPPGHPAAAPGLGGMGTYPPGMIVGGAPHDGSSHLVSYLFHSLK